MTSKALVRQAALLSDVRECKASRVSYLISCYVNLEVRHPHLKVTPLYIAASKGCLKIVKLLVEAGAEVNAGKTYLLMETPLYIAVKKRKYRVVEYLLSKGAYPLPYILWEAIGVNDCRLVKLLVQAGVDLEEYTTPYLSSAAGFGCLPSFKYLLEATVDSFLKPEHDPRVEFIYPDPPEVRLKSYLGAALGISLADAVRANQYRIVKVLLASEVFRIYTDYKVLINSALVEAVTAGHLDMVKLLVDNGGDVDACDSRERSLLDCTLSEEQLDVAEFLMAKGASLETRDYSGATPLLNAVWRDKHKSIIFLAKQSANFHASNDKGETVFRYRFSDQRRSDTLELVLRCMSNN